jgi:hypothetical protein
MTTDPTLYAHPTQSFQTSAAHEYAMKHVASRLFPIDSPLAAEVYRCNFNEYVKTHDALNKAVLHG